MKTFIAALCLLVMASDTNAEPCKGCQARICSPAICAGSCCEIGQCVVPMQTPPTQTLQVPAGRYEWRRVGWGRWTWVWVPAQVQIVYPR